MKRFQAQSLLFAAALLAVAFSVVSPALGQATFTAQLRGTVRDPSSATVPAAKVTIINTATGVSETNATDDMGRYIFNNLRPADYTVTVEAAGFKKIARPNVVLRVGQQTDLDINLEVGEVSATVDVPGTAPLLDSATATIGQQVDNRYVTEVPLLNRQIAYLAMLTPGVTETNSPSRDILTTGQNFVSNGQRAATAEIRVDGALITAPETGEGGQLRGSRYQPTPETVLEFSIFNNGMSAEYGNNGGTVINVVTKSGTNEFHGIGYAFFRRPQLEANNFFANRAGNPRGDFKRDQYGGAIGGPIKKNKTFFFFDYDRYVFASPATLTTSVPTALQRQGDFSQTFNPDGSLQQIFNPLASYKDGQGNWVRPPVPGNNIPAAELDPVALNIMKYYPQPNAAGDPVTALNNYTKSGTNNQTVHQFDIKLDNILSQKQRLAGRYSSSAAILTPFHPLGTGADDGGSNYPTTAHNATIQHAWDLSPTTILMTQLGLHRYNESGRPFPFDPTTLGFPSILNQGPPPVFPYINVANYTGLGVSGLSLYGLDTQYQVSPTLIKVIGGHSIKIGAELKFLATNFYRPGLSSGSFNFDPSTSRQSVFTPNASQGNGLASLLFGFGSSGTTESTRSAANMAKDTALFVQDDWRVTPRLTLNLGLRYDLSLPYTERYNRIQFADFTLNTGITVPGVGNIIGGNVFAGPGKRRVTADKNNIGPRFGLAYRLNEKTVLRAGAGVYYANNQTTNSYLDGPAFNTNSAWIPSLDGGITRFGSLQNPYPNGLTVPQGRKYGVQSLWGYSDSARLNNPIRNPEIYQWHAGIQRQLRDDVLIEVSYSASKSTHLPVSGTQNRNIISTALREQYGTAGLNELVPNPFQPLFKGPNAVFQEPSSRYNNATIPRILLLRPYPQFVGAFGGDFDLVGSAWYNSLRVRFEKRISHGFNLVGNYTYSKLMDNSSAGTNSWVGNSAAIQDLHNLRDEWSLGGSDTPHRFVFGWSYELPIGKGKAVGSQMSRALDAVVGGWQINGFTTFQSGTPLNITYAFSRLADGNQRPNISGNPLGADIQTVVDRKGNRFNVAAFSAPGDQQPGNSPRFNSQLRGAGIGNLDFSLFKNIPIRETMKVQLRAEFFNFTNTPRFGAPNTVFGSAAFGTINSQKNSPRQAQMGARFLF